MTALLPRFLNAPVDIDTLSEFSLSALAECSRRELSKVQGLSILLRMRGYNEGLGDSLTSLSPSSSPQRALS